MKGCNIIVATKATITGTTPNEVLELTVTSPKTIVHSTIHRLVVDIDLPSGNYPVVLKYENAKNTIPIYNRLSDSFRSNKLSRFKNVLLRLSVDPVHYSAICTYPCDGNTLTIDPKVLADYLPPTKTIRLGCGTVVSTETPSETKDNE